MRKLLFASVLTVGALGLAGASPTAAAGPEGWSQQAYLKAAERAIDAQEIGQAQSLLEQARMAIPNDGMITTNTHANLLSEAISALERRDTETARRSVELALQAPLVNDPSMDGPQFPLIGS